MDLYAAYTGPQQAGGVQGHLWEDDSLPLRTKLRSSGSGSKLGTFICRAISTAQTIYYFKIGEIRRNTFLEIFIKPMEMFGAVSLAEKTKPQRRPWTQAIIHFVFDI